MKKIILLSLLALPYIASAQRQYSEYYWVYYTVDSSLYVEREFKYGGYQDYVQRTILTERRAAMDDSTRATSTAERITSAPKDKIFRFNPAKENRVFPKQHPYFPKGCGNCNKGIGSKNLAYDPNSVWCQACKAIALCKDGTLGEQRISPAERDKIYNKPINQQYDKIETANGSTIYQHKLTCTHDEDYIRVKNAASVFADNYYSVKINPEINPKAQMGRQKIFPDMPETFKGNPDLTIKRVGYVDVKSPESPSKCVHWANFASSKQNAAVCLTDYRMTITETQIEHKNEEIWKSPLYKHDVIFWIINGRLRKYERPK